MESHRSKIVRGVGITAFWTFISRCLGMVRDVLTAALFGLSAGGVMDAFVLAFRLPNVFRRLFGEGVLSVSVLPVVAKKLEHDKSSAWQLVSTLLGCVFVMMASITVLAEAVCGLFLYFDTGEESQLIAGLSAVMLPYLLFISLASIVSAALHALNHFGTPAFVPIILNLLWIGVVLILAPRWKDHPDAVAYGIAAAVLVGGVLQLGVQWPVLRNLGFRWKWNWTACRDSLGQIGRQFVPMAFGLAILPLNTLIDTVVAWGFSAPLGTSIRWLGSDVIYPLREGTVAAIYFSERMIQFPVGLLGVVIGVVVFPTLSRQASRGQQQQFGLSLRESLRGNLFFAIPATAGLMLLAEPITSLLFEHGSFTSTDTLRTSQMLASYAVGVWAYSVVPVLVRGFYATGDSQTPFRFGVGVLFLNAVLDCFLIWRWGENGLAFASALSAAVFVILLTRQAHHRWELLASNHSQHQHSTRKPLWISVLQSCLATGVMYGLGSIVLAQLPIAESATFTYDLLRVGLPLGCCVAIYLGISALLGIRR